MLKIHHLIFTFFCLACVTVLRVNAQMSDSVNKCTINGEIVYQSVACPSAQTRNLPSISKNTTPSSSKQQDSSAMRAEVEALRVEKTKQKEETQKAAIVPKTASSQTDNVALSKSSSIDRMTTYTTVLGRGIGCGVSGTEAASTRFGAWMDSQGLTKNYLLVAAAGIKMAAEQQRAGNSPDSCSTVRAQFASFPWP